MVRDYEGHFDDPESGELDFDDSNDTDDVLMEEGEEENAVPYTTKDLALGVIDLFNSDMMDYDTGSYDKRENALDSLAELKSLAKMPESDWDDVASYEDFSKLQKFMEQNPQDAEEIFNTVANAFGFTNYNDYKSYIDNIDAEDEYYQSLMQDEYDDADSRGIEYYKNPWEFNEDDEIGGSFYDEATNVGAMPKAPMQHHKCTDPNCPDCSDEELDELIQEDDVLEESPRVWYHPYDYPDEEDYIDIDSDDNDEAIRQARSLGSVSDVEELEESYNDDSDTQPFYVEYWVSDINSSFSHGMPSPTLHRDIIYAYDEEQVKNIIEDDVWEMGKDYWLEGIADIHPATAEEIDSFSKDYNDYDNDDFEFPFNL